MKLFSTNNPRKIRDQIDAKRRDPFLQVFEMWREIGNIVLADLNRQGRFLNTQQGLFFFDKEYLRAFPLTANIGLAAIIQDRYGINPKEHCFKLILALLQTEAFLNGKRRRYDA
jgi:hypothetical protein